MIYFDITKAGRARHHSGLQRVSSRLRAELGARVESVVWENAQWLRVSDRGPVRPTAADWIVTPELFSEAERPGWSSWLQAGWPARCRVVAIFHDAIPLKFPQWTWPQSVARHPEYLKMLASFDRVLAVSETSRLELTEFWKWQGVTPRSSVGRIELGADFVGSAIPPANTPGAGASPGMGDPRHELLNTERPRLPTIAARVRKPRLVCIGIIEPRKNQSLLLDVAEQLIERGVRFEMDFVGRVNPHFGNPISYRLRRLAARYSEIRYHGAATDEAVLELWRGARASLFPTLAEGCGLPLLESVARGVPCLASDLPVLRESGEAGCVFIKTGDTNAWIESVERILTDDVWATELAIQASARPTVGWAHTAEQLLISLQSPC